MYLRHKVILFRLTSSQEYIFISCSLSGEPSPVGLWSVHPFSSDLSSDVLLVPHQLILFLLHLDNRFPFDSNFLLCPVILIFFSSLSIFCILMQRIIYMFFLYLDCLVSILHQRVVCCYHTTYIDFEEILHLPLFFIIFAIV